MTKLELVKNAYDTYYHEYPWGLTWDEVVTNLSNLGDWQLFADGAENLYIAYYKPGVVGYVAEITEFFEG